jgi:hypothetical protein
MLQARNQENSTSTGRSHRGLSIFAAFFLFGLLLHAQPVWAEGGEGRQRRYQVGWALGATLTPAVLFDQLSGEPFRANYGALEHGFQLGFEQDIQAMMAFTLRATLLGREITYTEPQGLSTVTRALPLLVLNAPLQLKFSPKRWFHLALGGYIEPCLSGGRSCRSSEATTPREKTSPSP